MGAFGPWESVRTIGQGGQGQIHVVHDSTGKRKGEFALKRLLNQKRSDRFQQEVAALEGLDHRGILRIIEFDKDGKVKSWSYSK